jgi:hypothetical protein
MAISETLQTNKNTSPEYAAELFIFFVGSHRIELLGHFNQPALELLTDEHFQEFQFSCHTSLITETRTAPHDSSEM